MVGPFLNTITTMPSPRTTTLHRQSIVLYTSLHFHALYHHSHQSSCPITLYHRCTPAAVHTVLPFHTVTGWRHSMASLHAITLCQRYVSALSTTPRHYSIPSLHTTRHTETLGHRTTPSNPFSSIPHLCTITLYPFTVYHHFGSRMLPSPRPAVSLRAPGPTQYPLVRTQWVLPAPLWSPYHAARTFQSAGDGLRYGLPVLCSPPSPPCVPPRPLCSQAMRQCGSDTACLGWCGLGIAAIAAHIAVSLIVASPSNRRMLTTHFHFRPWHCLARCGVVSSVRRMILYERWGMRRSGVAVL